MEKQQKMQEEIGITTFSQIQNDPPPPNKIHVPMGNMYIQIEGDCNNEIYAKKNVLPLISYN